MASEVKAKATAAAEKLAAEQGVDLASVTGSGKDGQIEKSDVQQFVDLQDQTDTSTAQVVQAADAGEEIEFIFPQPNPKRSAEEVVVYIGTERIAYPGGRALLPNEWDQIKGLKGEGYGGAQVALLVKGAGS